MVSDNFHLWHRVQRVFSIISGSLFLTLILGCQKELEVAPPAIISFTPSSGTFGTSVVISGQNFGEQPVVYVNETIAVVSGATTNERVVISIPAGATSGKIRVTNGEVSGLSSEDFIVYGSPVIEGFAPTQGYSESIVTITGKNFIPNKTGVALGETAAFVLDSSPTSLTVVVPEDATPGKITVSTLGGTTMSDDDFISNPPTITKVYSLLTAKPVSISCPGHRIVIEGATFSKTLSKNVLKFNGITASQTSFLADNRISMTVPPDVSTGKISISMGSYTFEYNQIINILQEKWQRLPNVFDAKINGATTFVINDKAYFGLGYNNADKTFWKFDSSSKTWNTSPAFPGEARWNAFCFVIGNKAYVGGGTGFGKTPQDLWTFDPDTNSWQLIGVIPFYYSIYDRSFSIDGKGYVINKNSIYIYDPNTNLWSEKTKPYLSSDYGSGFVFNHKFYIIDGRELWQYEPVAGTWSVKANYPGVAESKRLEFHLKGKFYFASGWSPFLSPLWPKQEECWSYDPSTDLWAVCSPFIGAFDWDNNSPFYFFSIKEKGYLIESNGPLPYPNYFYEFTP